MNDEVKTSRMRGAELRRIRKALGLSQTKFGRLLDRRAQAVCNYENDRQEIPGLVAEHARLIASLGREAALERLALLSRADARRILAAGAA